MSLLLRFVTVAPPAADVYVLSQPGAIKASVRIRFNVQQPNQPDTVGGDAPSLPQTYRPLKRLATPQPVATLPDVWLPVLPTVWRAPVRARPSQPGQPWPDPWAPSQPVAFKPQRKVAVTFFAQPFTDAAVAVDDYVPTLFDITRYDAKVYDRVVGGLLPLDDLPPVVPPAPPPDDGTGGAGGWPGMGHTPRKPPEKLPVKHVGPEPRKISLKVKPTGTPIRVEQARYEYRPRHKIKNIGVKKIASFSLPNTRRSGDDGDFIALLAALLSED